jgi:XTP/dITP diphosphohydrolase
MKIVFATNNQHKVKEIRSALPDDISIITLREAGIDVDIPEPHETLEENAAEKARTIFRLTGLDCFSEDTGLEVTALDNAPGVHSARYGGEEKSFTRNTGKLLSELKERTDRSARFRTVICLILEGKEHYFEGRCEGRIAGEPRGSQGFGYDPVFIPEGSVKSFAEMDMAEKNRYSHRKKATDMLVAFLNSINQTKNIE